MVREWNSEFKEEEDAPEELNESGSNYLLERERIDRKPGLNIPNFEKNIQTQRLINNIEETS